MDIEFLQALALWSFTNSFVCGVREEYRLPRETMRELLCDMERTIKPLLAADARKAQMAIAAASTEWQRDHELRELVLQGAERGVRAAFTFIQTSDQILGFEEA